MSPANRKSAFARRLLPFLALVLFAAALWVMHDALRQIHYQHVLVQLRSIPGRRILAALGLTALSYLVMTGYDRLALRYICHPLPLGKVTLAAFVSYAFSNTVGLSLLTSGSIRYRLYSAWELTAEEIARLVAFTTLTFWLGILAVAGGIFTAVPVALPLAGKIPFASSWPLGLFFIALVAAYLATVATRKAPFRFRSWELPLPSLPLAGFSLEGAKQKGLRYTYRRLTREGCAFEVVPATEVPGLLPELRQISNAWLAAKKTREKGFSLGRFDEEYLLNFPVAVVRRQGAVIAFANLWPGADRQELSIDLMRFAAAAPSGVMEYLFIHLLLWGRKAGYQTFDLGMAPLSGMENRPFAPLWNRLGAVIFQHGEHFYNFEGLREYKEKFNPVWEPRYLACPGGLALPRILLNVVALISGGLKGVVSK